MWFRKKKRSLNLTVNNNKLRLEEYRSEPALVGIAQKILASQDLKLMLQVVSNEHPGFQVFNPVNATEAMRAAQQAKCEGYTLCMANLEALAVPSKIVEPQQATYENEIIETV